MQRALKVLMDFSDAIVASSRISSNMFLTNLIFLFKVDGYKIPNFNVFASKDFLFKT